MPGMPGLPMMGLTPPLPGYEERPPSRREPELVLLFLFSAAGIAGLDVAIGGPSVLGLIIAAFLLAIAFLIGLGSSAKDVDENLVFPDREEWGPPPEDADHGRRDFR